MKQPIEITEGAVPEAPRDAPIPWTAGVRWQVVCGDDDHWRAGVYAPPEATCAEVVELEQHDCPELFVLVEGRMTIVYRDGDGELRELPLARGVPVLMEAPHGAYCPDGPHRGVALVIERTAFTTRFTPARVPAGTD
jgi:hypothetical protein